MRKKNTIDLKVVTHQVMHASGIILIGEIGGTAEEDAAALIKVRYYRSIRTWYLQFAYKNLQSKKIILAVLWISHQTDFTTVLLFLHVYIVQSISLCTCEFGNLVFSSLLNWSLVFLLLNKTWISTFCALNGTAELISPVAPRAFIQNSNFLTCVRMTNWLLAASKINSWHFIIMK